jgi:hypothetical protein
LNEAAVAGKIRLLRRIESMDYRIPAGTGMREYDNTM